MSDPNKPAEETLEIPRGDGPGGRIGPFKILQQIGEGGFGSVFEAEQETPVLRRVALKVIKLGMDTREVIARFEAERQALALMDHPHIARVLDAGESQLGRPYFVMELVRGEPITGYCKKHRLSIRERLQLFDQVCAAVQHAHVKGIIHRDLKPNNVLVSLQDDRPFAKVIDFGIAKATSGRLTEKTLFTEMNLMMGTPLYMSPEQAEGSADIDTRTDIYSLGVILYELLTDTTPIDSDSLRAAGYAEIQRIICEVEPLRPSARLSRSFAIRVGTADRQCIEPRKRVRLIRGELDWIVMKAIEKDRARRYETASALAMDVRRHMAGEPVHAATPSVFYRMQKFVRRNKGTVAAGSLIAAALLAGVVGFAWQAHIATVRADELDQVSKFQSAMLGQVDPTRAGRMLSEDVRDKFIAALVKAGVPEVERARQVAAFTASWQRVNATDTARDLIDRTVLKPAVAAIDREFKNQPVVDAKLRQVLADRYLGMGLYDAALPLQQQALATRRRVLGDEAPDTLASIHNMGLLLQKEGRLPEAESFDREAVQRMRRVLGGSHPSTLSAISNLAEVLGSEGKLEEEESLFREVLEKRRRILGEESPDTLSSILNMGFVLKRQGKLAEAETYDREAVEKMGHVLGGDHPTTLLAISNLAVLLGEEGKLAEAEPYDREVLAIRRRVLGEDNPDTLASILNMGVLLLQQDKLSEAEPFLREAVEKARRVLGEGHPITLYATGNLGYLLEREGKLNAAEPYDREMLENARNGLGDDNPITLGAIRLMGGLLDKKGKYAEAAALLAPSEPAARKAFTGANAPQFGTLLMNLGKADIGLGEFAVAESNLLEAHAIFATSHDPLHEKDMLACTRGMADLYSAWSAAEPGKGHDAKAIEWKQKLAALDAARHAPAAR
jgi:tetratricopeptide (TPR) repeat protein